MSGIVDKKLYVWRLAKFLSENNAKMSASELADHLNRNNFRTNVGHKYAGERGTLGMCAATYKWVNETLGFGEHEAGPIAGAFVKNDGSYAWQKEGPVTDGEE